MIDRSPSELQTENSSGEEVSPTPELQKAAVDPSPVPPIDEASTRRSAAAILRARALRLPTVEGPESPTTLEATGLTLLYIAELVLKHLYVQGNLIGVEIARNIRLPFQIVQESLRWLKDEKCIEVSSGDVIGPASYNFHLSEMGRRRAREAFEQCRYVGPAPIPLDDYVEQCRRQAVAGITCSAEALQEAFGELIIRDGLLDELGPAVCSGKSIFIYGPPGNGKTMIAKGLGNFLNIYGSDIYVPYAIAAEGAVITVYDPTVHQTTDSDDLIIDAEGFLIPGLNRRAGDHPLPDARWRRIRRPVVVTGGELTLEMLDLRYNRNSNFYTAPLHIKANGGVFLIDDFGRQIVSPRDLLNRWILPLEENVDFLSLATGKKFSVPFEQLIIFSTNLDPRELVDEAFLRRIRHKIEIDSPSRELYTEIFQLCCRHRQILFSPDVVDYLYCTFYYCGKPARSSDPRDLLEITKSICRFKKQRVVLTPELIAEAAKRFFCQI
jgi:predicted ATPase with chaperone activity